MTSFLVWPKPKSQVKVGLERIDPGVGDNRATLLIDGLFHADCFDLPLEETKVCERGPQLVPARAVNLLVRELGQLAGVGYRMLLPGKVEWLGAEIAGQATVRLGGVGPRQVASGDRLCELPVIEPEQHPAFTAALVQIWLQIRVQERPEDRGKLPFSRRGTRHPTFDLAEDGRVPRKQVQHLPLTQAVPRHGKQAQCPAH